MYRRRKLGGSNQSQQARDAQTRKTITGDTLENSGGRRRRPPSISVVVSFPSLPSTAPPDPYFLPGAWFWRKTFGFLGRPDLGSPSAPARIVLAADLLPPLALRLGPSAQISFSPTRAQARSQGLDLPRVGGFPSAASSDGGAVPGSAAASAAPPPASRPRLRPPRTGRRPCVRTSLSPPASAVPWEPGQLSRVAGPWLRRCWALFFEALQCGSSCLNLLRQFPVCVMEFSLYPRPGTYSDVWRLFHFMTCY